MSAPAILTIGHSTHELEEFLGLLRDSGVELLTDVRRFPGSRRVPWTNAESLERSLAEAEIGYRHFEELGGRRRDGKQSRNDGWRVAGFRAYADYMESPEFEAALDELQAEARQRLTAVMCAEAQWWRCHRRLVSDALTVRGWQVLHVDARGERSEHPLTEFAVVEGHRIRYPAQLTLDG